MDLKFIESFLTIFLFKKIDILELNIWKDVNICDFLKDEITYINNKYSIYFSLFIDDNFDLKVNFIDFNNLILLEDYIIKSIGILTWNLEEDILSYIKINFSQEIIDIIFPFFDFLYGNTKYSKDIIDLYLCKFSNIKFKNMIYFMFYWIWNDNKENTSKSISIIDNIIEDFPNLSSLYLLRIRQRFNYIYKILIWVHKFNKLILTEKGQEYIYNDLNIKKCFLDIERAEKLYPQNPTFLLFKWKFLLHLLNPTWLKFLLKYMKLRNILFDENVFSWIWVYYLQTWNIEKSRKYLEMVNYWDSDRYKAYSKLFFMYVKWNYKEDFLNLFKWKFKNTLVLLYNKWKYYKFDYNKWFSIYENIDDSYNHKDKMWFKLNNFISILNTKYIDERSYLEDIFNNISLNYYDHWYSELEQKVVFYSDNCFNFK